MPKIDTSKIEGYADMSAEDKLAALEAYEYDDNADEVGRYKSAASKANSEAADYKRQLKAEREKAQEAEARGAEGQTEAERKLAELQGQLKAMQRDKSVSDYTARLLSSGFGEDVAGTAATALVDGDAESFFDSLSKFVVAHDKALKAEMAQHSVAPSTGSTNPDGAVKMTSRKLASMSPRERMEWRSRHPEEAASLN